MRTNENRFIECVRGVSSLFVAFTHCRFPGQVGLGVVAMARFAVPFFLMLSGYYAYKDSEEEIIAYTKRKLLSTIRLTIVATIICVVGNMLISLLKGKGSMSWLVPFVNKEALKNFIFLNRAVFLSSVMWYLFAVIYVYIIYVLLVKAHLLKWTYWCIPILMFCNIWINEIQGNPWYYAGNFLLTGLPFFLLGNYMHKNRKEEINISIWFLILCIITSAITSVIENLVFYQDAICYISTIVLVCSIFQLCLQSQKQKVPKLLYQFGKKYSIIIFVLHCTVRDFLKVFVDVNATAMMQWIFPAVLVIICIIIGWLYYKIRPEKC